MNTGGTHHEVELSVHSFAYRHLRFVRCRRKKDQISLFSSYVCKMQVKITQVAAVYQSSFHFFSPSVRHGENGLIGGHFFLPEESDGSCRVLSCL